jgi:hypothetical protein
MRYRDIITEMPVRNWRTVGSFDKPRSIHRADDVALVTNPKYQNKVRRLFAKVALPVDMFFINIDEPFTQARASRVSDADFQHLTGVAHPADDAITMLYTWSQDRSAGGLPITPWILAHKIGECFHDTTRHEDAFVATTWDDFLRHARKLLRDRYGTSPSGKHAGSYISAQRFYQMVFTMKSARDGKLFNATEALAECVAQFLVTGSVTFRATGFMRSMNNPPPCART